MLKDVPFYTYTPNTSGCNNYAFFSGIENTVEPLQSQQKIFNYI